MFRHPVFDSLSPFHYHQLLLRLEAANEKEVKRNTLAVVSRKPTRVSQEELAGKEALSKQYFKDNGIAKLGQAEKAKTTGNQATPKANTSTPTGRSGIPGKCL